MVCVVEDTPMYFYRQPKKKKKVKCPNSLTNSTSTRGVLAKCGDGKRRAIDEVSPHLSQPRVYDLFCYASSTTCHQRLTWQRRPIKEVNLSLQAKNAAQPLWRAIFSCLYTSFKRAKPPTRLFGNSMTPLITQLFPFRI